LYLVYLLVLVAIELASAAVSPALGAALHGILILVLLNMQVFKPDLPGGRLWAGLALVSLLRFFSLVVPLGLVPRVLWTGVICLPLWVGMVLFLRHYRLGKAEIGLGTANWRQQGLIGLSGLPLGLAGSLLLHPEPYFPVFSWFGLVFAGLLVLVSVGFTEEVLFRGLLTTLAQPELKAAALPFVSAVYASMYIGAQSPAVLLWMWLVGAFWGWCASRTRSVWGAALAHGLMVVGMMLVWPYLINSYGKI
jgi:hypothetical protein